MDGSWGYYLADQLMSTFLVHYPVLNTLHTLCIHIHPQNTVYIYSIYENVVLILKDLR